MSAFRFFTRITHRLQCKPYATLTSPPPLLKRSPSEIARRVASTQMLLTRWGIEAAQSTAQGKDDTGRIAQSYEALCSAIDQSKINRSFTEREQALIDKPLGTWSSVDDVAGQFPRWESFGILLWALRIVDGIPRYHAHFPRELLFQATAIVPAFPHTVGDFIDYFATGEGSKASHIVSDDELRKAINVAEAWVWRQKTQVVLDLKESLKGDSPEVKEARKQIPKPLKDIMMNIEQGLQSASARAAAEGFIDQVVDDDFGVDGAAYRKLDDHDMRDLSDIAEYRLAALGWLTGKDWEFKRGEVGWINPMGSLWEPAEH